MQKKPVLRPQLLINQTDKIRPLLFRLEDRLSKNYNSRGKRVLASALLMVVFSLLPYSDMIIDIFVDTKTISVERFANLSYAIWAYATPLSALMVLLISKVFKPPRWTYLVTVYVNISQIIAYIYLQFNIEIQSDWVFRGINLLFSLILSCIFCKVYSFYKEYRLKDELMEEFLKSRNHYEQKN